MNTTMYPHRIICNCTVVVLYLMFCAGCYKGPFAVFTTPKGEIDVRLKIARTEEEREKGLMFQTHLREKEGMLFIFEDEQIRSFWMKNTFLYLDVVFVNEQGVIVDLLERLPPCAAEPCPLYSPSSPSRYVIELNGGFIHNYSIRKGERVRIVHN